MTNNTKDLAPTIARLARYLSAAMATAKATKTMLAANALLPVGVLTSEEIKAAENLIARAEGEIAAYNITIQELTALSEGY